MRVVHKKEDLLFIDLGILVIAVATSIDSDYIFLPKGALCKNVTTSHPII
jgi:hypothetical protein